MSTFMELGVVLDAGPALGIGRCLRIVVSDYKVLATIQLREELRAVTSLWRHEISEMPHVVVMSYNGVPIADKRSIMRGHVREGTAVDAKDARVPEVSVSGEENHSS
ncbi:hypothetical protein D3C80_899540 [compost metagenome]